MKKIQLSDHFTYGKLLRFTLPSIVMMIFTSIYGIVDGIFVSNFAGKVPFTALNLVWPLIMMVGSFGFMVGAGGTALISKTLGEGDREKANEIFTLLNWVCIIGGAALTALALIFLRPIVIWMGAEGEVLENAVLYGNIVLPAAPAYILQFAHQNFCVAAEKAGLSLWMTVACGVCNIILDALFVGVFRWGLTGAAVATAISQYLGAIIAIVYFACPNSSLLRLGKCRFDGFALMRTFVNGSSELLNNISLNLVGMLYNIQLLRYAGEDGVAAYGVIMYVNLIFLSIFIGYAIGTAPLIGFNFGAQNHPEQKNIFRKSMVILALSGFLMMVFGILLSRPLAMIFVGYDQTLLDMTVRAFIIYSVSFLPTGVNMYGSSMFTALNNGLVSAVISFVRTLVCQLAAVLLLPLIWELDGIWWSVVAAEFAALLLTLFCFLKYRKRYHYA